jgi:hypothetical protein
MMATHPAATHITISVTAASNAPTQRGIQFTRRFCKPKEGE